MKLYTEEQLLKAIQLGRNYGGWVTTEPEILNQLTPIELPSDDEIEEDMKGQSGEYACGWEDAFNWMKEQILNQKETRVLGESDDKQFWSDKPNQNK